MKKNQKLTVIVILLLISGSNFLRLPGNENIRAVQYISLLVIGALAGLLINELITLYKSKQEIKRVD